VYILCEVLTVAHEAKTMSGFSMNKGFVDCHGTSPWFVSIL